MFLEHRARLSAFFAWGLVLAACDVDPSPPVPASPKAQLQLVETQDPVPADPVAPAAPPIGTAPVEAPPPTAPPPVVPATIKAKTLPEIVLDKAPNVDQLAITSRHFYASVGFRKLVRIGRATAERTMLLEERPLKLQVDAQGVYFTTYRGLFRVDHDGKEPTMLLDVETLDEIDRLIEFAVDDESIYLTPFSRPGIFRIPKSGGALEQLSRQKRVDTLVATASHLYFASFFRRRIGRMNKSGGRLELLMPSAAGPVDLAVDGRRIVALLETTGQVVVINARSKRHRRLANAGLNPQNVVIAGDHAYFLVGRVGPGDSTSIRRVAIRGGSTDEMVESTDVLSLLAVEDGWLYFSVEDEPNVFRILVD